jgi:hypothetical protein
VIVESDHKIVQELVGSLTSLGVPWSVFASDPVPDPVAKCELRSTPVSTSLSRLKWGATKMVLGVTVVSLA